MLLGTNERNTKRTSTGMSIAAVRSSRAIPSSKAPLYVEPFGAIRGGEFIVERKRIDRGMHPKASKPKSPTVRAEGDFLRCGLKEIIHSPVNRITIELLLQKRASADNKVFPRTLCADVGIALRACGLALNQANMHISMHLHCVLDDCIEEVQLSRTASFAILLVKQLVWLEIWRPRRSTIWCDGRPGLPMHVVAHNLLGSCNKVGICRI